jgi:hypothetical protein
VSALAAYRHPPRVRALLESLVGVACPPEALELSLAGAIADHVELSMRSLPAPVRAGLLAGMAAYELSAVAWPGGSARPASALDARRARRWFELWRRSPIGLQREFIKGLGGLLCLAHYEMPAIKQRIGYTPEAWIDTVTRRRLEVYADDIRRHDESLVRPDPLPGLADAARAKEAS